MKAYVGMYEYLLPTTVYYKLPHNAKHMLVKASAPELDKNLL